MTFTAIIPARYASTRFPGKPLAVLGGKTVIQRVYEQVSNVLNEVYVATDDERIFSCVESFGGKAVMTRKDHQSGTDRIQEAVEKTGTQADVIINVQGDEPFIQPSQIQTLMQLFDDLSTQIGTLGKPFESMEAVENPNSPKIVTDNRGFALYFSRSIIPYIRGKERKDWFGEYPCLFKDGEEVVKLNPNNYAQDIDGNPVDRKGRESGAVAMVAERLSHPRRTDGCGDCRHRYSRRPATGRSSLEPNWLEDKLQRLKQLNQ